jgi:hypothetical protein
LATGSVNAPQLKRRETPRDRSAKTVGQKRLRTIVDKHGVRAAFGAKLLQRVVAHSATCQIVRQASHRMRRELPRVDGRTELVRHAAFDDEPSARLRGDPAAERSRDQRVSVEGRLDVEPDPVDERQHFLESLRISAAGVQSNLEAHLFHRPHRVSERALRERLAAGEDDRIEKTLPPAQKRENVHPRDLRRAADGEQMRVVTITTPPRTALAEHHGRELARIIGRRQGRRAADPQLPRPGG